MNNKTVTPKHGDPAPLDFAAANVSLSEFAQAKVRCYLNVLLMGLAMVAYYYQPSLGFDRVIFTFIATAGSAAFLFLWALAIQKGHLRGKWRIAQRITSIILDNVSITWILWFGGQSLAGIYGIYIWISVGYGLRYGLPWLYANLVTSVIGFSIGGYFSPFWSQFPGLFGGLIFGLIIVPVYTGFLIKKLNQTTAERESAYQAKSQFIARMSHELRTPLHGIISMADLMNREPLSPSMREKMRMISVSSTTLLELINKVLDISKFESGKAELLVQPMDLHSVVCDAATIVTPKAKEKGLQVYTYIDSRLDNQLMGSPHQLSEVLVNLAGNAAKFTETGFISIKACRVSDSDLSTRVLFEIVDTGPGIPEHELEHVFESFAQVDNSITRKYGGTGLGTAISREIVQLMGGTIEVASKVGVGTQFSFEVEFDKQKDRDSIHSIYPLNALVIGANESQKGTLVSNLGKLGAAVNFVENPNDVAQAPIETAEESKPDLIYVCVNRFENNLGAFSRKLIQQYGDDRSIPQVGIGEESLRQKCISAGFSSYISDDLDGAHIERTLGIARAFKQDYVDKETFEIDSGALRIIVADDNVTNQRIAQLTLEEAGHHCTLVSSGREFLDRVADEEFDIGILDMHMPDIDGVETARIFKFSFFDREMPIIMMTADNRIEARAAAEGAGIEKFLTKPLKPAILVRTISELVPRAATPLSGYTPDSISNLPSADHRDSLLAYKELDELLEYMEHAEAVNFFDEFFDDAEHQINVLSGEISLNEVETIKDNMHSLAGAAATVGARSLSEIARQIELSDANQILTNAHEFLEKLKTVFERTKRGIKARYTEQAADKTA